MLCREQVFELIRATDPREGMTNPTRGITNPRERTANQIHKITNQTHITFLNAIVLLTHRRTIEVQKNSTLRDEMQPLNKES